MSSPESVVSFGSNAAWSRVAGFLAGTLRRHRLRLAVVALLFVSVGAVAAVLLPRTYSAQSRLLVKKNYVMPALASPRRAVPTGSEALTQSAAEFVLSRQSLTDLVERCHLLERWDRERPAALALKDRLVARVRGPMSVEDKADAIVELLATRIRVTVEDEVVRVRATWSNPVTVVDIVNGAIEEFLDARRKVDIQAIADTSAILAKAAATERARVEEQLAAVALARKQAPPSPSRSITAARPASAPPPAVPSRDGLDDLRAQIAAARASRDAIERQRADEIARARSRIAERRAVVTERHPDVLALRRALAQLEAEPAALVSARAHETALIADYASRGGTLAALDLGVAPVAPPDAAGHADRGITGSDLALALAPPAPDDEDDTVSYQRALLKSLLENYQDLLGRLANVQVELHTAQAAFPYRYSITAPARVPKQADSPNPALLVVGALLAGLAAGLVSAVSSELRAQALTSPAALRRFLAAEAA